MLKLLLFLLACSLAFCLKDGQETIYNIEYVQYYFNDFVTTYNKQYQTEAETQYRFKVFTDNIKKINALNSDETDSATYAINMFSDLTTEEFLGMYTGLKNISNNNILGASCKEVNDGDIQLNQSPDAFDWRDKNVVSPVKNQANCGSCYAFSSVGNIESLYAMKNNGKILDLSEQQLVDCSKSNHQCNGGFMTQSMMDVINLGGLASETSYPYKAKPGTCKFNPSNAAIKISGCYHYNFKDEKTLKDLLYQNGPISIAIAGASLQTYHKGILKNCYGSVNHAVLLVGYGSEKGEDFWIIKNSYGTNFGERGYVRILRGKNTCNLINVFAASAVI